MKVNIQELSAVEKKVEVELPVESVNSAINELYNELKKSAKVRGFRPGKAPRTILEQYYGRHVKEEAQGKLISDAYQKVVEEKSINPVSQPKIDSPELVLGAPYSFSFVVEVHPEITIKDYKGLKLYKEKLQVGDNDVERILGNMRERMARLDPVTEERPLATDDVAVLHVSPVGEIKPKKQDDFILDPAHEERFPGLREKLLGMKKGETRQIDWHAHDAHGCEEHGGCHEQHLDVELKEIKKKILPALDDEFAKDMGKFGSLAELRDDIRKRYTEEETNRIDNQLKIALFQEILKTNPVPVPQTLVAAFSQQMAERDFAELRSQGIDIRQIGLNLDAMAADYWQRAAGELKLGYVIKSITDQEKIEVVDAEVDAKINELTEKIEDEKRREMAVRYFGEKNTRESLKGQLVEKKVFDLLLGAATIEEVDKETLQKIYTPPPAEEQPAAESKEQA